MIAEAARGSVTSGENCQRTLKDKTREHFERTVHRMCGVDNPHISGGVVFQERDVCRGKCPRPDEVRLERGERVEERAISSGHHVLHGVWHQ